MNKPLLRKVRDMIAKRPRRFNMESLTSKNCADGRRADCGTACCIYGWGLVLSRKFSSAKSLYEKLFKGCARNILMPEDLFGIGTNDAQNLIWFHNWPEPYRKAYCDATTAKEHAKAGVARINHFLKTGK